MSMTILSPGPLTTVQDLGRFGYMEFGFSPSGAMDPISAQVANLLVDNQSGDAVLEMTMLGIHAVFNCDTVIALAGGDFSPALNGKPVAMYSAVHVKTGDKLICGAAKTGCRCYMAVAGGFDIAKVLGSCSTNLKCGIGGFEGRKLKAGDKVPFRCPQISKYNHHTKMILEPPLKTGGIVRIRVISGPQNKVFTQKGIDTFYNEVYTVTGESDRMGIRLDGSPVEAANTVDIISDGTALGSIQITPAGKPIVLMADRQTTGGYAKIATVITADIPKLAQARPGSKIIFEEVSVKSAQKFYKAEQRKLKRLSHALLRA